MIVLAVTLLGLCFGSFVNALVWRIHEQDKHSGKGSKDLSIVKGRSMCTHCGHVLSTQDLIPIVSWLMLRGKCRYCGKKIEDTPFTELITAALYVASYLYWPAELAGIQWVYFGFWLIFITGFVALVLYDIRWMMLPNRIVYPLLALAVVGVGIRLAVEPEKVQLLTTALWGIAIGGGIFYMLFQVSDGKWIGGGDVKLGALLGLIIGGPLEAMLLLFLAASLGSAWSLPLLATKRIQRNSRVPFGPFLIVAGILVQLFGAALIAWYKRLFLPFAA
jgi:prepilin signal peptidase PulO-like enzyme (type II secretory pathway)